MYKRNAASNDIKRKARAVTQIRQDQKSNRDNAFANRRMISLSKDSDEEQDAPVVNRFTNKENVGKY